MHGIGITVNTGIGEIRHLKNNNKSIGQKQLLRRTPRAARGSAQTLFTLGEERVLPAKARSSCFSLLAKYSIEPKNVQMAISRLYC
jgi:hypothetical protein